MNFEQASKKAEELVAQMTLSEKASLCSGADFWHTKGIERLGLPSIMVTDGPHGLRKQEAAADHLGLNASVKAVCFPAGCAMAASFDRQAAETLGETLGEECQSEDVGIILGPAMNIKRSPLCGRNFEYYSEDPYLASETGTAYVRGVQSKHVGTSPKHFCANNQEYHRMTSDSKMDERTEREIYLAAFEGVVKQAKPWSIMNSYNKVNGTYMCENKKMLHNVLRDEWGFDGFVMTDWGAMDDRVQALDAGCNLEMPYGGPDNDKAVEEAVKTGKLSEETLDQSCKEIVRRVLQFTDGRAPVQFSLENAHETARKLEEECAVLLKNEDEILPLVKGKKLAVIGSFAKTPRYQGGGSSHINSFRVSGAFDSLKEFTDCVYAPGYERDGEQTSEELLAQAVQAALAADTAIIFAGLPDSFESEGYDRKHLRMPEAQTALIKEVAKVQPNTVVVLHNGAPVEMPWIGDVKGVVEAYLGGEAVGEAIANILTGAVNPSGRLPETFPLRLQDTPCYLTYGGENDKVEYREGVFVGYRYYESKEMPVLFPFGYGLSYTQFTYSNFRCERTKFTESGGTEVLVDVTNTGKMAGKEVVQLYVSKRDSRFIRPVRELKGYEKVSLRPGETKTVHFTLDARAFALWHEQLHDWFVESGEYELQLGRSARDIAERLCVQVKGEKEERQTFTINSRLGAIMHTKLGKKFLDGLGLKEALSAMSGAGDGVMTDGMMASIIEDMPLRSLSMFMPGISRRSLQELADSLNQDPEDLEPVK